MNQCIKYMVCLLLLMAPVAMHAQSKQELENRKTKLRKEIEETNKLLEETTRSQKASLISLQALKKKITARIELIRTINSEISLTDQLIESATADISDKERELKELKEEYAKMIYFAYKNQNAYQRMMFVFAADDFNQAYKRLKYMQQYGAYRQQQAELILEKRKELEEKKQQLEAEKNNKKRLLGNEVNERKSLDNEKNQQITLFNSLKHTEKKLQNDLKAKQQAEAKLNKAIEDIVRREIEAARKRAEAAGKKNVTTANALTMTPEAARLSSDFASNKGKLPWPVEQGVITSTFGEHPHPVLAGIKTKNNGIDINTNKGAVARSLFEGEVTGVVVIPGANKAVIIRHGEYLTVYSNLADVMVRMGEKVSTKQPLGVVYYNAEESKSEIHLEIWQNINKLDPSAWLFMRN